MKKEFKVNDKCVCGHLYKEHNYSKELNKIMGDGMCLHWNDENGYCKCERFRIAEDDLK